MSPIKHNSENALRIINAIGVSLLLKNQEALIIERVRVAYERHNDGYSNLPHSVFLRFPDDSRNRIIGLPSFLDGDEPSAGFKWIASFPENHQKSLDRASALIILNNMDNGFPKAVLEASIISAKRTAASAALALKHLHGDEFESLGIIGCGLIGFEIIRFIKAARPSLKNIYVYDLSDDRAEYFAKKLSYEGIDIRCVIVESVKKLFSVSPVVALATTSAIPYINKEEICASTKLVLNVSLRDLAPEIILDSINIVDDVDHVCRERTSIHLAEESAGNRKFISGTIAEVTKGLIKIDPGHSEMIVFSPFGLGVLDLSIAEYVYHRACEEDIGYSFQEFFPAAWCTEMKKSECVAQV